MIPPEWDLVELAVLALFILFGGVCLFLALLVEKGYWLASTLEDHDSACKFCRGWKAFEEEVK